MACPYLRIAYTTAFAYHIFASTLHTSGTRLILCAWAYSRTETLENIFPGKNSLSVVSGGGRTGLLRAPICHPLGASPRLLGDRPHAIPISGGLANQTLVHHYS